MKRNIFKHIVLFMKLWFFISTAQLVKNWNIISKGFPRPAFFSTRDVTLIRGDDKEGTHWWALLQIRMWAALFSTHRHLLVIAHSPTHVISHLHTPKKQKNTNTSTQHMTHINWTPEKNVRSHLFYKHSHVIVHSLWHTAACVTGRPTKGMTASNFSLQAIYWVK